MGCSRVGSTSYLTPEGAGLTGIVIAVIPSSRQTSDFKSQPHIQGTFSSQSQRSHNAEFVSSYNLKWLSIEKQDLGEPRVAQVLGAFNRSLSGRMMTQASAGGGLRAVLSAQSWRTANLQFEQSESAQACLKGDKQSNWGYARSFRKLLFRTCRTPGQSEKKQTPIYEGYHSVLPKQVTVRALSAWSIFPRKR